MNLANLYYQRTLGHIDTLKILRLVVTRGNITQVKSCKGGKIEKILLLEKESLNLGQIKLGI